MKPLDRRVRSGRIQSLNPPAILLFPLFGRVLLLPLVCLATGTTTSCTEANLRAAMAGGGVVSLACDERQTVD